MFGLFKNSVNCNSHTKILIENYHILVENEMKELKMQNKRNWWPHFSKLQMRVSSSLLLRNWSKDDGMFSFIHIVTWHTFIRRCGVSIFTPQYDCTSFMVQNKSTYGFVNLHWLERWFLEGLLLTHWRLQYDYV